MVDFGNKVLPILGPVLISVIAITFFTIACCHTCRTIKGKSSSSSTSSSHKSKLNTTFPGQYPNPKEEDMYVSSPYPYQPPVMDPNFVQGYPQNQIYQNQASNVYTEA